MNYSHLFTPCHVALMHDWLTEKGQLSMWLEFPHSGGSGASYSIYSLTELWGLLSEQTHPEVEIFIFKNKELSEEELDSRLDLQWVYGNPDQVLYASVKKNRNYYEEYQRNPGKYKDVLAQWPEQT